MKEIQLQIGNSVYAIPVQALERAIVITTKTDAQAAAERLEGDDAGAHALSYLSSPETYAAAEPYIHWVTGEQIELTHQLVMSAWAKIVTRVG